MDENPAGYKRRISRKKRKQKKSKIFPNGIFSFNEKNMRRRWTIFLRCNICFIFRVLRVSFHLSDDTDNIKLALQ